MATYRFTGRFLPEGARLSWTGLPPFKFLSRITARPFTLTVRAVNSLIEIHCEVEDPQSEDHIEFYMRALETVRAFADIIAFEGGLGISVSLEKFFRPDGQEEVFHFGRSELRDAVTSFNATDRSDMGKVCGLVFGDGRLRMALRDLNEGFVSPDVSLINYARAVETLRNMIAPEDADPAASWAAMRAALNIDRSYLQPITSASTELRHGRWERIEASVLNEIALRTWKIMDRFFAYRLKGRVPLSEPEHPLLTEGGSIA